ncbi:MAG: GH25 family lysozyme [Mycobacteriales bacterium]
MQFPRTTPLVRILALALVVLIAGPAFVWFFWLPHHRPGLRPGEVYGVDVSSSDGVIDWVGVAQAGMRFAYVRATAGDSVTDDRFLDNWEGAGATGLRRGAVHAFSLCSDGVDQAVYFLGTAPRAAGALPPAVELNLAGNCAKRPDPDAVNQQFKVFLATVEGAWKARMLIFVGADWQKRYPVPTSVDRPRWRAGLLSRPAQPWAVWRLHGYAHVDGIKPRVDLDVGRLADLGTVP